MAQTPILPCPPYGVPAGFVAYPSVPQIAEVFRNAIREINKPHHVILTPWEDCKVEGKVIIDVILRKIEESDFFCADITGVNANVLFELGAAVGKNKRTWLLLDTSIQNAKKDFDELGLLSTVAYTPYSNSEHVVKKFYKASPHEDLSETILDGLKPSLPTSHRPQGLLYLKSSVENEPSISINKRINESNLTTTIDDPQEALKSLLWYAQHVYSDSSGCMSLHPGQQGGG